MKRLISVILAAVLLLPTATLCAVAANADTASFGGHSYTRIDESMTWHEAKEYCESKGGYLATITSSGEAKVINSLIEKGSKDQYWIGATDEKEEGKWEWITGEKFCYIPQNYNLDNAYGREDYLQIYRNNWGDASALGFWNDSADDNHINGEEAFFSLEHVGFICETGTGEIACEQNIDMPVIYIIGRTGIYREDGSGIIDENTTFMTEVVEKNGDLLAKAILTNNYTAYCDAIYKEIAEVYADYRLNNEGEVENGSGIRWSWSNDTLTSIQGGIYTYRFEYDARLDPCDIADDLKEYVDAIKAKTGFNKFNLVSRCLGCCIATAYLAEYGWKDINSNIMYASAAKGYDFVGELFAGKMKFNSESLDYYLNEHLDSQDSEIFEDEYLLGLAKASISYAEKINLLKLGTKTADYVFGKISQILVPKLLLATYATCPGYWAMVNDDNYEAAKAFIFGSETGTTYKTLIKKIDNYHYNVMNKTENMLSKMKADGLNMIVIAKYGFQTPPFIESSDELGDNRIDVTSQSFGATTAKTGETLPTSYLLKAVMNDTFRYISVDRQIDASTCLFPDSTWFIKNNVHNAFYDCFNEWLMEMCRSRTQYTITTRSDRPQYLYYNNGEVTPLNLMNMKNQDYSTNILIAFFRLIKAVLSFTKSRSFIH